ncbi:MAG: TolC family protein [Gammaproteobacteria bacterium]
MSPRRSRAGLLGLVPALVCALVMAQQPTPPANAPPPGSVLPAPAALAAPAAPAALVEATTPEASGPILTLEECIKFALARGFDLEIERQSLSIAQDNVPIARSTFLPIFSATTGKAVTRSAIDPDLSLPSTMTATVDASAAVSQRLLTGTQLSLGLNNNHFNIDPAVAALSPAYTSDVTLAVTQPLLKGFGTRLNSQVIRRAELGLDVAGNNYESRALDVIQGTENAYYIVTGARDQLQVFRASLQLAQALLNEAQSRRTAGMATGLDVLQAEVGVANARRSVLDAQRTVHASEDALTALIGRFQFDTPLGATRADEDTNEPAPTIASSYRLATERYPALRNARSSLEIAQLDVAFARNDLLPSVDLDLALGFNGGDSTRRGSFSGITEPDGHNWQAGISITYPLGRVAEKARFRQSRFALTQAELREKQLEQDVLVAVRNAVRDVETSRESVTIAGQAADLSRRQYEAETERFRAGLSTSRRVLEAQTDLESARVANLQARLDLQTARATLRRLEGTSLQRYGISLDVAR